MGQIIEFRTRPEWEQEKNIEKMLNLLNDLHRKTESQQNDK